MTRWLSSGSLKLLETRLFGATAISPIDTVLCDIDILHHHQLRGLLLTGLLCDVIKVLRALHGLLSLATALENRTHVLFHVLVYWRSSGKLLLIVRN
jgi:hypothetical protein